MAPEADTVEECAKHLEGMAEDLELQASEVYGRSEMWRRKELEWRAMGLRRGAEELRLDLVEE